MRYPDASLYDTQFTIQRHHLQLSASHQRQPEALYNARRIINCSFIEISLQKSQARTAYPHESPLPLKTAFLHTKRKEIYLPIFCMEQQNSAFHEQDLMLVCLSVFVSSMKLQVIKTVIQDKHCSYLHYLSRSTSNV